MLCLGLHSTKRKKKHADTLTVANTDTDAHIYWPWNIHTCINTNTDTGSLWNSLIHTDTDTHTVCHINWLFPLTLSDGHTRTRIDTLILTLSCTRCQIFTFTEWLSLTLTLKLADSESHTQTHWHSWRLTYLPSHCHLRWYMHPYAESHTDTLTLTDTYTEAFTCTVEEPQKEGPNRSFESTLREASQGSIPK